MASPSASNIHRKSMWCAPSKSSSEPSSSVSLTQPAPSSGSQSCARGSSHPFVAALLTATSSVGNCRQACAFWHRAGGSASVQFPPFRIVAASRRCPKTCHKDNVDVCRANPSQEALLLSPDQAGNPLNFSDLQHVELYESNSCGAEPRIRELRPCGMSRVQEEP